MDIFSSETTPPPPNVDNVCCLFNLLKIIFLWKTACLNNIEFPLSKKALSKFWPVGVMGELENVAERWKDELYWWWEKVSA